MKIIQIGSNIGNDSLSKYLEDIKTELEFAVLVEPNLLHIDKLKSCYSKFNNVIIENIAIKPSFVDENKLTIYYYEEDAPLYAVASCSKEHIRKHYLNFTEEKLHSFEVPCLTLDELFQKYNIIDLDWLLLDVEGIDVELLLNTDWSKYNIQRIEYENLHLANKEEKINEMFKSFGYIKTPSLHRFDTAWSKNTQNKIMEITLYAIAKNEEKNIEKFIENSKKFSHTIVVDTGSTDKTVELLQEAGIEVHEHPQIREEFDFAKARNTALSYVKTDWAFSLDFNEEISEFFPEGLDVISSEFTAFNHERYDKEGENEPTLGQASHIRFHRTKNYTWINTVHETPMFIPTEEHFNEVTVETTIKITKSIQKSIDKELFYLSICEREYEEYKDTYYLWFIFKHYFGVKNFQKAVELGQEYLNLSKPYFDPNRVEVFIMTSIALIQLQDIQIASNYAFHALSEAMNFGGNVMGKAFIHLLNIGKITQNRNIIIFASGFSPETLELPERTTAIIELSNRIKDED